MVKWPKFTWTSQIHMTRNVMRNVAWLMRLLVGYEYYLFGELHFKTDNRGLFELQPWFSQFGLVLKQVWLNLHQVDFQEMWWQNMKFSAKVINLSCGSDFPQDRKAFKLNLNNNKGAWFIWNQNSFKILVFFQQQSAVIGAWVLSKMFEHNVNGDVIVQNVRKLFQVVVLSGSWIEMEPVFVDSPEFYGKLAELSRKEDNED